VGYLASVISSDKGKDGLNTLEGINDGHLPSNNGRASIFPPLVASFVIIACTEPNTATGPQYPRPRTCEDALLLSHLYSSVRIFKTDSIHARQGVRVGRMADGPSQQPAS